MQKQSAVMVIMGVLVVAGLALSVWGDQILFEDFAKGEGRIGAGEGLSARVEMDESQSGVFAVEVLELEQDAIHATVTDPHGNQILRKLIAKNAHEGYFDTGVGGTYTLAIDNSGQADAIVAGYIGPEPDASKRTVAFVSIYILIVGLAGMPIAIVYAAVTRKRR